MKKKGYFLAPIIYNFAKKKRLEFNLKNKPTVNIRSSTYIKIFKNCVFKVHTGKNFVVNDVQYIENVFKEYPFTHFKLGQFSYNKKVYIRGRRTLEISFVMDDLRRKKGFDMKFKKKKKSIFTPVKKIK